MSKRRVKNDVIVIDDDDEPPVKKDQKEPTPSAVIADLRKQLQQSEEKFQKLCGVARRDKEALKSKLEYLETVIDSKEAIRKDAYTSTVENELKKKVGELMNQLEKEKQKSTGLLEKLAHFSELEKRVAELSSELEQERNLSAELQQKLIAADSKEGILKDPYTLAVENELKKKLSEVSRELVEERQWSDEQQWKLAHVQELEKKVDELTNQLVEERQNSDSLQQKLAHFAELEKKFDGLTNQLVEERQNSDSLQQKLVHFAGLEKRVNVLECDLKEANKQASEQRSRDEKRVAELTSQLEKEQSAKMGELANQLEKEKQKSTGLHEKLAYFEGLEKKLSEQASQLEQERNRSTELKKKLAQVGSQLMEQNHSIMATLASVDVSSPTSSSASLSTRPSKAASDSSTQQKPAGSLASVDVSTSSVYFGPVPPPIPPYSAKSTSSTSVQQKIVSNGATPYIMQNNQQIKEGVQSRSNLDIATGSLGSTSQTQSDAVSPSGQPQVLQPAVQSAQFSRSECDGSWTISCICGQEEDDGETFIGCDRCKYRWEHVDCIFPVTKQVPLGKYLCHTCLPRQTYLTPEQARAYQDRVKACKAEQLLEAKSLEAQKRLAKKMEEIFNKTSQNSGLGTAPKDV